MEVQVVRGDVGGFFGSADGISFLVQMTAGVCSGTGASAGSGGGRAS